MHGTGDTMPRPLDECGPDTDWGDDFAPRTIAVLSPDMIDALRQLEPGNGSGPDLLEVVACILRLREPVLLAMAVDGWVWPVSLYPRARLYRAPVDWLRAPPAGLWGARLLTCEPPPAEPPALPGVPWRSLPPCHYPLDGLLWSLALLGPRNGLLGALAGAKTFRVVSAKHEAVLAQLPGALGSAVARLRAGPAEFSQICRWPGLDAVRAARLLNALYLKGRLVTQEGPLDHDDDKSAWSHTVPSRWPAQGTVVRARPRTRFTV